MALILALDIATNTGWALLRDGELLDHGRIELGKQRWHRRPFGLRHRLSALLASLPDGQTVSCVAYEKVRRHAGTEAAHVYGALEAAVLAWAEAWALPVVTVGVAAAKIALTGRGNATKEQMVAGAHRAFGGLPETLTDDEADAMGVALAADAAWPGA